MNNVKLASAPPIGKNEKEGSWVPFHYSALHQFLVGPAGTPVERG